MQIQLKGTSLEVLTQLSAHQLGARIRLKIEEKDLTPEMQGRFPVKDGEYISILLLANGYDAILIEVAKLAETKGGITLDI